MTNNSKITSYPKGKIKILFLENIHPAGIDLLKSAGYKNITCMEKALSDEDLQKELQKDIKVLGIRSKTNVSKSTIDQFGSQLLSIGCFCIGTNQVALSDANKNGIAVFNSPYSNTRSVAELVIGLTIMLFRQIAEKNKAAHEGKWLKTATHSHEIRGKCIGIVGYGNIGSQVSVLAESMGMKVYYYDVSARLPLGNARATKSLEELLSLSDVVTLHVPQTEGTKNMIHKKTLKQFKKGAFLINYARGNVININDLIDALKANHLSGAAVDVFPEEPENNQQRFHSPLQQLPNVILTPHIGGSTQEAQEQIAIDVASKMLAYIERGSTAGSKSLPEIEVPIMEGSHRILHIHRNIPGVISQITNILYKNNININSQSLKSNQDIGYAVFDLDANLSKEAYALLKEVPQTIKARLLY